MKFIADTHTHTLVCGHAYSTLEENIRAAKQAGMKFLCHTEHAPALPGAPGEFYFKNLSVIPDQVEGIAVLKGCEANILNSDGEVDVPDFVLDALDWVIASLHKPCFPPSTEEEHTKAWLNVAKNPLIDVIGHCGNEQFRFDYQQGIKAFKEYGKIVELNNASIFSRPGSKENCREIALLCKRYEVPVVVSSDAHFSGAVGQFPFILPMLEEIDFPQRLVLNADFDRFHQVVCEKTRNRFRDFQG